MTITQDTTNPNGIVAQDQGDEEEERFPHWEPSIDEHLDLEFEILREASSTVTYGLHHVIQEIFDRYDALFKSQLDEETYRKWWKFNDTLSSLESDIREATIEACRRILPNMPTRIGSYVAMRDEAFAAAGLTGPEDADRIAQNVFPQGITYTMEKQVRRIFPDIDPESWRYRVACQQVKEGVEQRQQAERDAGLWAILSSGAREWVSGEEVRLLEIYRAADGQGKRVIMAYVGWISKLKGLDALPEYSEALVQQIYAECWEQIDYSHRQTARTLVREFLSKAGEANEGSQDE